jgi:hypothetical protein
MKKGSQSEFKKYSKNKEGLELIVSSPPYSVPRIGLLRRVMMEFGC